jgi:hypothetical protein
MLRNRSLAAALFGSLMSLALAGSAGTALAQETAEGMPAHPAFIQAGDCSNLDENPVGTLEVVGPMVPEGDEEETPEVQGALGASSVLYAESEDVELPFDDVLAESHSVVVHLSEEEIQTNISCGEVGGVVIDDKLVIALHSVNDSGYTGIAILEKDGDDKVDVEIYLAEPVNPENVPDATPVG